MVYFGKSILVAYYCPEKISHPVEKILIKTKRPAISQLTEVELSSAVSRKIRENELSKDDGNRILSVFQSHKDKNGFVFLPIQPKHYSMAMEWISAFDTPLRTLDALHLAVAHINKISLLAADIKFFDSAKLLGVEASLVTQ